MSTSSRNVRPRRFDGAVVSGRGWVSFRHPFGAKGFPALGLALFFLLCGCRTPAPSTSRRARDVPAEALAAYSQGLQRDFVGDPKGALGFYLQALEAHPSGSPAYLRALAAHGELRRGDTESGLLDALLDLAARHPREMEPRRWIARLHAADSRFEEAVQAYAEILRTRPSDARLHAEQLALLLRADRPDVLAAAFNDALDRNISPAVLAPPAGEWYIRARQEKAPANVVANALHTLDRIQARASDVPAVLLLIGHIFSQVGETDRAGNAYEQARRAAPGESRVYVQQSLLDISRDAYADARATLADGIAVTDQPLELLRLLIAVATQHAFILSEHGEAEAAQAARDEAITAVRRLLESLPRESRLWLHLGDLLMLSGRMEDAVRELGQIPHPDADLQQDIARRLLAAGAPDEALERIRALAQENPGDPGIHLMLGELLYQTGDHAEAMDVLVRAARMNHPIPAVFLRRALWLAEKQELAAALSAVDEGMAVLGEAPAFLEVRALLLIEAERPEEALTWIARLQAKSDGEEPAGGWRLHRALALQYAGEPREAALLLADELSDNPDTAERFVHLSGRLNVRSGTHEPTRATLRKLSELVPHEPGAHIAAGLYEHLVGEHAAAVEHFEATRAAAEERPDSGRWLTAPFFFVYGAASERAGYDGPAMEHLAEAIRLDPDHADALNYLAYMWAERAMNLDRALVYVNRALEHDPESAPYIDTLGWIYYQQGRFEEARVELKRALEGMPDDPTILDHVGDALNALGRTEEALDYWRKALENEPEDPAAIRAKLREHGIALPDSEEEAPEEPREEPPSDPPAPSPQTSPAEPA